MNITVVLGAGGFIGHHLVNKLKSEGAYVIGIDLKLPVYEKSKADTFIIGDLRDFSFVEKVIPEKTIELYQLAADMGGQDIFLQAKMTLTLCIIQFLLI
jgi:GDP-D-mannose 3',5'-epimerase